VDMQSQREGVRRPRAEISRSRFDFTCADTERYDSEYNRLDALMMRVLSYICQHLAPSSSSTSSSVLSSSSMFTPNAASLTEAKPHRSRAGDPPVSALIRPALQHRGVRCCVKRVRRMAYVFV